MRRSSANAFLGRCRFGFLSSQAAWISLAAPKWLHAQTGSNSVQSVPPLPERAPFVACLIHSLRFGMARLGGALIDMFPIHLRKGPRASTRDLPGGSHEENLGTPSAKRAK